uniref:Uncharacterized protein n=3 Tax=Oryza TaxID=4527 RepID=A0A0D9ZK56_9ORYZ
MAVAGKMSEDEKLPFSPLEMVGSRQELKLFQSELVGVRNSILKSVSRVVRPHPWCAAFGISTGETDIMGTAKNPIGFRCNKCMKKDSSLHDQNQHMTNVPTDRSTCLKESSDNVHGATNRFSSD